MQLLLIVQFYLLYNAIIMNYTIQLLLIILRNYHKLYFAINVNYTLQLL